MKYQQSSILRDFDKKLAIIGIILSIILVTYLNSPFSQSLFQIIRFLGSISCLLALVSCLLWIVIRKSHTPLSFPNTSQRLTRICMILFFCLFTISIVIVYARPDLYERPISYFFIVALMAGMISCEALASDRKHAGIILLQIILLGISIAWTQLLLFPSLVGIDPWYHSSVTSQIVANGHIPGGYSYSRLPLFHLTLASTSLVLDLPYKFAAMVSVSLIQIISNSVFVYLIADRLFRNHRVGLLAALLVIVANYHICWSYRSVPNSFAVIFIPIIIYLIINMVQNKEPDAKKKLAMTIAMFVAMMAIIFTHSLAALGLAIILFVGWASTQLYRYFYSKTSRPIQLSIPMMFIVAMLAWWSYASGHINALGYFIRRQFDTDTIIRPSPVLDDYVSSYLIEQLFNNLGMFLFFALSLIGIFFMISRRGSNMTFAMAWMGLTPLIISFISLVSGSTVVENRWWYLAQIFLSIPLAMALLLIGRWQFKKPSHIYSFTFLAIATLCFISIVSPSANFENNTFSPNTSYTSALTESEIHSIATIGNIYSGSIGTEGYVAGAGSFVSGDVRLIGIDRQISSGNYSELNLQNVLVRSELIENAVKLFQTPYRLDYDIENRLNSIGYCKTYTSNSIAIYSIA